MQRRALFIQHPFGFHVASPVNRYTADARIIMVTSIGPSMSSAMISSAGELNSSFILFKCMLWHALLYLSSARVYYFRTLSKLGK